MPTCTDIKDECKKLDKELTDASSKYPDAVRNVKEDSCLSGNSNGNITIEVLESICKKRKSSTEKLEDTLRAHQSFKIPHKYSSYDKNNVKRLKRVLSLNDFVRFHINDDSVDKFTFFYNPASLSSYKKDILEQENSFSMDQEDLIGTTGCMDSQTWWTFNLDDYPPPTTASTYVNELALEENYQEEIKNDGLAIEITIPSKALNKPLFKPNALDGFNENTRFRPELTGLPYGMTCPVDDSFRGRPELVSESERYQELKFETITINKITW